MALENGGLDAQVEQRMDAYRSNPQQLQQRYGQNKELLDLLALQKLTSEKQAAARDMQMKMQQQPGTIAQQREQEALELTKQEMGSTLGELAGRTKGTLDQKQAMQQQNMQKMAQGQPPVAQGGIGALMGGQQARPPMQGVPPQAQGLANARMQAPVQMAKGGIVSFAGADGNNEVVGPGTPFSRFMKPLLEKKGSRLLTPEMQALRKRVRKKFETYGGIPAGLFTQQTPEMQEYASEVLSNINLLSEEELLRLEQTEFDPVAVTAETVSDLPALPTEAKPKPEPETVNPLSVSDVDDQIGLADPITYPSSYKDPQAILSEVDTSFTPEVAEMPSTGGIDNAEARVAAAASKTADPALLKVDGPLVPGLTAVEAPYDDRGKAISDKLLGMYESDVDSDPNSAAATARADSDAHLRRAENDADFRRMSKEEKELQARLFSPAQLASEARIATFGGAARGRGGMSAAYTDIMGKQRTDLTDALGRLRGIDETRISTDLDTAKTSSARGSEAASRAESRRASGLAGLGNELDRQQARALQKQELEAKGNVAVYNHQSALAQKTYDAAEASITRNFQSLQQQVVNERTTFDALVKINVASAEERNNARDAELKQLLEIAKSKAEYAFKNGELAQKTVTELTELKNTIDTKVLEFVTEQMRKDPAYISLTEKMLEMSESENLAGFKKLEAEAEIMYKAYLKSLVTMFPDIFGEQEYLKDLIARAQAGTPFAGATRLPSNTPVIPLDNPPTGP
jgi:tellurite resistance protein